MKNPLKNEIEKAKRMLEQAVSAHKEALRKFEDRSETADQFHAQLFRDVFFTHPNAAQVGGYVRRVEKLMTHVPATAVTRGVLAAVESCSNEVARLKAENLKRGTEMQREADARRAETPDRKAARELNFTEETLAHVKIALAPTEAQIRGWYEERLIKQYRGIVAELTAKNWDLKAAYPYPDSNMSRSRYEHAKAMNSLANSFVINDTDRQRAAGFPRNVDFVKLELTEAAQIDALNAKAAQMAKDALASYCYKLSGKIQSELAKADTVTAVRYVGSSDVWGWSVLTVTTAAGEVHTWNTQMIMNFSVHGKAFNQWPTRLADKKEAVAS